MSRDADALDRRTFVGATAAAAAAMFIKPELVHGTPANSAVRVGLLGCGGRGTEDAANLVDTGGARVVALADIICGEAYYLTGYIDRPPWPNASPAERRLRNWVRDRVLSGDIIVEQNIHVIDICNWVLKAHPLNATATGGRLGRPADDGDCYGNYHVVFRYPGNVDVTFSSTQFAKGWWDVSQRFFGTKGTSLSPYVVPLGILWAE